MIRKAVIPIAGLGTRLAPLTSAVPKALLPLIDAELRVRPVLHCILAEAAAAGIEDAAIVISPGHEAMVKAYLHAAADAPPPMPRSISLIVQSKPEGFGAAVARAAKFVAGEPFLVMLGDHVYQAAKGSAACAAQVCGAFDARPCSAMIGVRQVDEDELSRVGVVQGRNAREGVYLCSYMVEKPDVGTARERLATPGLLPGRFLAHGGLFAFGPEIFDCLAELARAPKKPGQELGLTEAQSLLRARHPDGYYLCLFSGRPFDTGTPEGYASALAALAQFNATP